ncbi:MAG: MFS transporter [Dehalococcoidia bacterium]
MGQDRRGRLLDWLPVALLGIATIGAYGISQYAIGTLLPAIAAAEAWPSGTLAGGYAVGILLQGPVALLAGREFDRRGSRRVLLPASLIGCSMLLVASMAPNAWSFVACWALGSAAIGGGLYYSMTMPATVRLYPERRAQALSVLTLIGALAAPLFSPLAAVLVEALGWRSAIRALVLVAALCVLPAARFVAAPAGVPVQGTATHGGWTEALRSPAVRWVLLVTAIGGMANHALLLHQVGALRAAGLSLAAASAYAGARGGFQILGRLTLAPLTARLGIRRALALCHALAATAVLSVLLLAAQGGWAPLALYFAVMGGVSMGLLSPLNGLLQAEAYGDEWLGRLSGVTVIVVSVAGWLGSWGVGLAGDARGSIVGPFAAIAGFQLVAVALLVLGSGAQGGRPRPVRDNKASPANEISRR